MFPYNIEMYRYIHSGSTSKPLIMLAQYPAVADADNINPIPRFSLRSPGSFIQLLLVLFCKTLEVMFGDMLQRQ